MRVVLDVVAEGLPDLGDVPVNLAGGEAAPAVTSRQATEPRHIAHRYDPDRVFRFAQGLA